MFLLLYDVSREALVPTLFPLQLTLVALSPAIMRLKHEANNLFPRTVEVTSAVLCVLSLYLHDMHRDNRGFTM